MKKTRIMRTAAAALSALLIFSGCGAAGSSSAEKAKAAETTAAAGEAAANASAAADDAKDDAAPDKESASEKSGDAAGKETDSAKEGAADASAAVDPAKEEAAAAKPAFPDGPPLAERLEGRYICTEGEEVLVLELMNVFGNLYAKSGTAMDYVEGEFPEPYSFWAMELIPKEAGALQRPDLDEAAVGILTFSVMSNLSRYWSSPKLTTLHLTEDGVAFTGVKGLPEFMNSSADRVEFRRWEEKEPSSADPEKPGSDGGNIYSGSLPEDWGTEIPKELFGLWKEKNSDTPYFLELSKAENVTGKDRGLIRLYRKQPGTEVELRDGRFLVTGPLIWTLEGNGEEAEPDPPLNSGTMMTNCTSLGTADMPTGWTHEFILEDENTLTFLCQENGATEISMDSVFSPGQDTVFQRIEEKDVPLCALAEADDVSALLHEGTAETPDGIRPVIPQFLPSEDVENNGGNFLRVGDVVFFRDVSEGLGDVAAAFGEFLGSPELGKNSRVCYYDKKTGKTGTAFTDGGFGPLWYLDGRIYSAVTAESTNENYIGQAIHRCWPDGSGMEMVTDCNFAQITSASEKNKFLSVMQYQDGNETCTIFDGSMYPVQDYEPEGDGYIFYSGFAGEDLILVSHTGAPYQYTVSELDTETGSVTVLGDLPVSEEQKLCAPDITQMYVEGDTIYLGVGWYAGTGHFLNDYYVVKMKALKENSLETALAEFSGDQPEEMAEAPKFFLNYADDLLLTEHDPDGEVFLSDYDSGDLIYNDSPFSAIRLGKDFLPASRARSSQAEEVCILQDAEFVGGAAWIITADAVRSPENDIGWREAYAPGKMTWQRIQVYDVTVSADENYPVETLLEGKAK